MTTITFLTDGDLKVNADGRIIKVPFDRIAYLDSELRDAANQAKEIPGTPVIVPSKSYARGLKPRNSVVHGVRL